MAVTPRASEAGLADLETGVPGSSTPHLYSPRYGWKRAGSYRAIGASPSPRSGGARFFCEPHSDDERHYFLAACFLCKKPLGGNRDIFMYRGDTPFCSEECRQEQIDLDEAKERLRNLSYKSTSRNENQKQTSRTKQSLQVRAAGTVAAG